MSRRGEWHWDVLLGSSDGVEVTACLRKMVDFERILMALASGRVLDFVVSGAAIT